MEITEKQKKIIGVVVGVGVVGGITTAIYYYYRKPKEVESDELHSRLDSYDEIEQLRFPKLTGDSRWRDIDSRYEDLDNVNDRMRRRNRFTVYTKNNSLKDNSSLDGRVQKRFKVLEKDESVIDRSGRLRTSGERYRHTPSGYNFNRNNRNANFNDLIIP